MTVELRNKKVLTPLEKKKKGVEVEPPTINMEPIPEEQPHAIFVFF